MSDNAQNIKDMLEHARYICGRYGIKSHLVLSCQGGALGTMVRKRLIADFVLAGADIYDIGCVLGYEDAASVSYHVVEMKLGTKNPVGIPDLWPLSPQEIIEREGGWPMRGSRKETPRRRKIVKALLAECPGITYAGLGRMIGLDHAGVLRYAKDDVFERSCKRVRDWHVLNLERSKMLKQRRKEYRELIRQANAKFAKEMEEFDKDKKLRNNRNDRRRRLQDYIAQLSGGKAQLSLPSLASAGDVGKKLDTVS